MSIQEARIYIIRYAVLKGQALFYRTQGKYSLITDGQHITQWPDILVCVLYVEHSMTGGVMYPSNLTLNQLYYISM